MLDEVRLILDADMKEGAQSDLDNRQKHRRREDARDQNVLDAVKRTGLRSVVIGKRRHGHGRLPARYSVRIACT
jgi:hypothetical protein